MTTHYRIAPCSGRYLAIYNGEREMLNSDIITRLHGRDGRVMAQDTTIHALRLQLANAHHAIDAALELLKQQSYGAATIVLEDALKGTRMTTDDKPGDEKPIDIPDEKPPITPGGPPPPEWGAAMGGGGAT